MLNRITQIEEALGGTTNYSYDENGNLVEMEDPNGHPTSFTYDEANRQTSTTDALDHTTSYAYDEVGNIVSIEDANGKVAEREYDELNRLVLITDALDQTTSFDYDAVGNILNITDANDHTTTQTWDELNRLIEVENPLGNTTVYEYDESGNEVGRTDAKGQHTDYTYDELDRLVQIGYPDDTEVVIQYDEEGNVVHFEGWGFSRSDEYDLLGRVTKIEYDLGPFNKTVSYTYDEVGDRLTMVDGEDETTEYEWNELNRLISLTAPGDLTFTFDYDSASRRTKLTYPDGMYTNYSYNDANWITLVESKASNHTLLESFEYGYDDVGNKVDVTYENGTTVDYAYDDVYRLVSEDYSWDLTINYTYDWTGNRLTETRNGVQVNYTYDEEDHLLSRGNVSYEWDDNGNLVKKVEWNGNTTYEWDYENRLVQVVLPNETTLEYAYDALGMRLSESVDDEVTYLFYDFRDLTGRFEDLIAEYNSTGSRVASFVHGPGADEPLALTNGGTTEYYMHDGLGSATGLATSNGISAIHRYEAFGAILFGSDFPYRYGFTSREAESYESMYFYRARWFEPSHGRFVSKDPLGISEGPNLYVYVSNNPSSKTDPSGRCAWWDWWCHIVCGVCRFVAGGLLNLLIWWGVGKVLGWNVCIAAAHVVCAWLIPAGGVGYLICMGIIIVLCAALIVIWTQATAWSICQNARLC